MTSLTGTLWKLKIWKDTRGQDFLEYALIAAFIATSYGAISPAIVTNVSGVFSKVSSTLTRAGGH